MRESSVALRTTDLSKCSEGWSVPSPLETGRTSVVVRLAAAKPLLFVVE